MGVRHGGEITSDVHKPVGAQRQVCGLLQQIPLSISICERTLCNAIMIMGD